jgi:hypothetical protein
MKKTNLKLLLLAVAISLVSCKKEESPITNSSLTDKRTSLSNLRNAILVNPDPPTCVTLWPTWTYDVYQGVWGYNYVWPVIHNDTIQVQWKIHPGVFWHKGNIRRLYPAYATSYDIVMDGVTIEQGSLPSIGTDFNINRTITFPQPTYQTAVDTHPGIDTTKNWHQLWLSVYFNNTTMADGNIYAGDGFLCHRP